ncbi:ATP-binding cassette domain-containing protein [bacterium]|nr:ATP-binding cassette domain-containing protein [bacterium]
MAITVDIKKRLGKFDLEVNFKATDGVHGLLGASGCGKSVTLLCIAGVVKPDSGYIEIDGRVLFDSSKKIDLIPQKRKVGLLFQNYALFPNMTVKENLRAALHANPKINKDEAIKEMIRRFHLQGLENHRPVQLSGGQQQRTALARILLSEPKLLMLDEPLSALDSYLRHQTELELMEVFDSFKGTILFVSHSCGEVRRLCKSATVIDSGRSEGSLPVEKFFEYPQTISQAITAGWQNYSHVKKIDEHRLLAEDWGFELTFSHIPENCQYVAIRAHHLQLTDRPGENTLPVKILRTVTDINFTTLILSAQENSTNNGHLRLETDSFQQNTDKNTYLHIPSESVIFLTK